MQELQERGIPTLGWEDPLEKEMTIHSKILAWENPRTKETGGLQALGLQTVGHHSNWAQPSKWFQILEMRGLIKTKKKKKYIE